MSPRHVVVDGSNIATEGRSLPSLKQLDEAVREFLAENPQDNVTVVVDASFGHRIGPDEQKAFEEAEAAGEIVSPPAGAIGRGDAFLLRIADKTGATVLSNDSFQEFHGEYDWLFTNGRLIGGKPVPEVGWIFTPRSPVRGPKSREAVKEAKRKKAGPAKDVVAGDGSTPGIDAAAQRAKGKGRGRKTLERAIATATEEAVAPDERGKRRRRRSKGGAPPAEPVNEPTVFLQFVASHKLGDPVEGEVDSFASHGAFVLAGGARCYLPLQAMGEPPPRSARELLNRGEVREFVVQAFDPARRGVELAMPGYARVAGTPTEETVKAEIRSAPVRDALAPKPKRTRASKAAAPAAERAPIAERATAKKAAAPAKKAAAPTKKTAVKNTVAKKTAAKNAATPAKSTAPKKTVAKKTAAKKAATPAKKAAGPSKKAAAPAKKAATPAKKAPANKAAAPAKKTAAKKTAPAKKSVAKKGAAKKGAAR